MPLYPVLTRSLLALRGAKREGGAIPRRRKRGGRRRGPFLPQPRYTKLQLVQFPNEKHLFPRPPPPTPQNDKVPLLVEKREGREGLLAQERDRKPGKMEAVSLAAAEGLIRRGRDTLPIYSSSSPLPSFLPPHPPFYWPCYLVASGQGTKIPSFPGHILGSHRAFYPRGLYKNT